MSESSRCPSSEELARIVRFADYDEFRAGWRDGTTRSDTDPASTAVIEDLALLLDSVALVQRISPPE